jgi:hypothetical protein
MVKLLAATQAVRLAGIEDVFATERLRRLDPASIGHDRLLACVKTAKMPGTAFRTYSVRRLPVRRNLLI